MEALAPVAAIYPNAAAIATTFPMITPRTESAPKLIHHTGTDSNEWEMPERIRFPCN